MNPYPIIIGVVSLSLGCFKYIVVIIFCHFSSILVSFFSKSKSRFYQNESALSVSLLCAYEWRTVEDKSEFDDLAIFSLSWLNFMSYSWPRYYCIFRLHRSQRIIRLTFTNYLSSKQNDSSKFPLLEHSHQYNYDSVTTQLKTYISASFQVHLVGIIQYRFHLWFSALTAP